jgi:predicted esterase
VRTLTITTPTHGRALIRDATVSVPAGLLVGFHGYAQSAEDMLSELERIPGSDARTLVSVQALHRFYSRGEERVIASWMTRQDRDVAVADNIAYVDSVLDELVARPHSSRVEPSASPIVFVGFSQGAAMAYRAGVLGRHHAAGIIALGGDMPPEVKRPDIGSFPRLLIGAGDRDFWYTPAKVDADVHWLESRRVPFDLIRYSGAHEWTDEFRTAAGAWLHS